LKQPYTSDSDFLYEINSIPKEIRENYIRSLIRGGNLKGQKNFLFASYVEKIVSNGLNEWDRDKVLWALNITNKMLACYKCRMIKKLREQYFNIKRKNKEDNLNFAKRLSKCGMNREARTIFLKLITKYSEEISNKNYSNITDLSGIYSWFALYYLNLKNYKRFSFYRKKLFSLRKYLYRLNSFSQAVLKCDLYKVESYKRVFRLSTYKAQKISVSLKLKSLKEAKKINDYDSILLLLLQIGINFKLNKKYDEAEFYFNEGIFFAKKINSDNDVFH